MTRINESKQRIEPSNRTKEANQGIESTNRIHEPNERIDSRHRINALKQRIEIRSLCKRFERGAPRLIHTETHDREPPHYTYRDTRQRVESKHLNPSLLGFLPGII